MRSSASTTVTFGAELGEGGAELQPDIAGADHRQALAARAGSDSASVEEMTGPPNGSARQRRRHRAGGEHDMLGADGLRPVSVSTRQVLPSSIVAAAVR